MRKQSWKLCFGTGADRIAAVVTVAVRSLFCVTENYAGISCYTKGPAGQDFLLNEHVVNNLLKQIALMGKVEKLLFKHPVSGAVLCISERRGQ